MSEKTESPQRRERTLVRYVALLAALVVLCPVSWIAAHQLFARDVPPAPWPPSDLGAVPSSDENGLADLTLVTAPRLEQPDDRLLALVSDLDGDTPEARWLEIAAQAHRFEDYLQDPSTETARRRVDEVLGHPRFVDPCAAIGGECRVLDLLSFARHAAVLSVADALSGRWEPAFSRAKRLIHASLGYLATARTMLAHMTAIAIARFVVDHLRVLVAALRAKVGNAAAGDESALDAALLPGIRPALRAALDELGELRRDDVHCDRAMISENLWVRAGLREVIHAPFDGHGFVGHWLTDEGRTVAWVDEYFRALHAYASAPSGAGPPAFEDPASGPVWWVWNPGGKRLIAPLLAAYDQLIPRFESEADEVFRSRDALHDEAEPLFAAR